MRKDIGVKYIFILSLFLLKRKLTEITRNSVMVLHPQWTFILKKNIKNEGEPCSYGTSF